MHQVTLKLTSPITHLLFSDGCAQIGDLWCYSCNVYGVCLFLLNGCTSISQCLAPSAGSLGPFLLPTLPHARGHRPFQLAPHHVLLHLFFFDRLCLYPFPASLGRRWPNWAYGCYPSPSHPDRARSFRCGPKCHGVCFPKHKDKTAAKIIARLKAI